MIDACGRNINYLRISVTDRCNMRCVYCMPEEGVASVSHDQILRYSEILRICRSAVELGITRIKLTGGEPLVRRGIVDLVRDIHSLDGIEEVTMTTNGVLLEDMYEELVEAGLDSVTISIDTLNQERFAALTRRDELPRVLRGLNHAVREGRIPVKINCVALADTSGQELLDIAGLARDQALHVRFIELMPIGLGRDGKGWTEDMLRSLLEEHYGVMTPCSLHLGNGPARYSEFPGFQGKIGWISAVSHSFCHECNRVRLTSDGYLKCCLQYDRGVDLRPALAQTEDSWLTEELRRGIMMKPERHSFGRKSDIPEEEHRKMSQIGG